MRELTTVSGMIQSQYKWKEQRIKLFHSTNIIWWQFI